MINNDRNLNKRHNIVTAALPYANGYIHVGHLAGSLLPADIYARYLRLKQEDIIFISGSDEHGVPITIAAQKNNITPQQIVDKYHFANKKSLEELGISCDIFSRTTHECHKQLSQEFFTHLYNHDKLIEKETEQYYDTVFNKFLADRYIRGTCPKCGYDDAYGDQCERCGITLSPEELTNPRSYLSGSKPILKKTRHWYLPLKEYESWLKEWILEQHKDWKVNVYGQCKSWLEQGLQDRPITRDLGWGVTVPLPEAQDKVLYVWFDAPIGYISFTKELLGDMYKDYWCNKDTNLIHFIGKDNIVFHSIIFPVMLKAHGDYVLPSVVCGNEFMNLDGGKISKSRDHAIYLKDYLEQYPTKQDVLRYVLCANMPETKDSDFTWEDFKRRNNTELVDTLGNYVNRILSMYIRYFNGYIRRLDITKQKDIDIINHTNTLINSVDGNLSHFKFKDSLNDVLEIARIGNKYITDEAPWNGSVTSERREEILYTAVQVMAKLSIVSEPFMPFSAKKMQNILQIQDISWSKSLDYQLVNDISVQNVELLFEKIK